MAVNNELAKDVDESGRPNPAGFSFFCKQQTEYIFWRLIARATLIYNCNKHVLYSTVRKIMHNEKFMVYDELHM